MGWRCEITMRTKLHGKICSLNLSACLSFWALAYSIRLVGLPACHSGSALQRASAVERGNETLEKIHGMWKNDVRMGGAVVASHVDRMCHDGDEGDAVLYG